LNLQITFRDFDHSDAVEAHVRRRAEKLPTLFERITTCRVVVEEPHRHHQKGRKFHVRIDMIVPQKELVVSKDDGDNDKREDMHATIDDAFDDAERMLEEYSRRLRDFDRERIMHGEKPREGISR